MVQSFRAGREEMAALRFCPLVHHVKIKKSCVLLRYPKRLKNWYQVAAGKSVVGVERVVFLSLNGMFTAKASGKNFTRF